MPISTKDIIALRRAGIVSAPPKPEVPEKKGPTTEQILSSIADSQRKIAEAGNKQTEPPEVNVEVKAPVVNVAAPKVTVQAPSVPLKWTFKHKYDNRGDLIETVATAET